MPLLLSLLPILAFSAPFITTWNVTQSPYQVVLKLKGNSNSTNTNVTIDWGDSSLGTLAIGGLSFTTISHNFTTPGVFFVSVFGNFYWGGDYGTKLNLNNIVSWGDGFLVDQNSANLFSNYYNLRVSADPNTHPVFLPGAVLDSMFSLTSFDSPLNWDLANVTSLARMFASTPLNNPITFTNTQGVTSLSATFSSTPIFNQPFSFDCTSVTSLASMFGNSGFNSSLNLMNTQKVATTGGMFTRSSFNQPLTLDTRSVTDMDSMFSYSSFNQPLNLNTSQVTSFYSMFTQSSFNQPLSMDTSRATEMGYMFEGSNFSSTVNFTSVARVTSMYNMFAGANGFTQDLSSWNVTATVQCDRFCPFCVLPAFTCPNVCGGLPYTNSRNQSVCFSEAPTTAAPSATPSMAPSTASPSRAPTSPAPSVAPSPAPSSPVVSAANGAAEPFCLIVFAFCSVLCVSFGF